MIDVLSNLHKPAQFVDSGGECKGGILASCLWKPALQEVLGGKMPATMYIQPSNNIVVSDTVTPMAQNDGECEAKTL